VSGYYDAKVSLGGMTQICVASGLVVDVEAGTQQGTQKFLGRNSRQLWHQDVICLSAIRSGFDVRGTVQGTIDLGKLYFDRLTTAPKEVLRTPVF
jgi:hypothetical protein